MTTVQEALQSGSFYIAYQPIVSLANGKPYGYEALVRSESDEFPHAGAVIGAAVEAGFMGQLGRALRSMAVEGCPDAPLFLNIHPDEFDEGWLVRPDDAINAHDCEIYLEITESVPLSHYRHCHSVLAEVRRRGLRVAVDDLGAGYSNLKYIADLAPEVVKLDRQLVAGLTVESRLQRLVTSIVHLCRSQGARVVAEGIETPEELRAVIDSGAHYGQGFLLARPARELPAVNWESAVAGA